MDLESTFLGPWSCWLFCIFFLHIHTSRPTFTVSSSQTTLFLQTDLAPASWLSFSNWNRSFPPIFLSLIRYVHIYHLLHCIHLVNHIALHALSPYLLPMSFFLPVWQQDEDLDECTVEPSRQLNSSQFRVSDIGLKFWPLSDQQSWVSDKAIPIYHECFKYLFLKWIWLISCLV